jgi:ribA/ribD-fused uncharacterized protein
METTDSIYFFGVRDDYAFLSNFYKCNFIENGVLYNCAEQYFMYHKCKTFEPTNKVLLNAILTETSPTMIKKYGRLVRNFNEERWDKLKYDIMYNAIKLKFHQNNDIYIKLIDTKNKKLYEASQYDTIWGIGLSVKDATSKKHRGLNMLGELLMAFRDVETI